MDATRLMTSTCTIVHVAQTGAVDDYGTPTEETTETTAKCWLSQGTRRESTGEVVQMDSWALYLPAGTAIDGGDRVEVEGMTFEVDGPPWPAKNPRTNTPSHIEASLKRAG